MARRARGGHLPFPGPIGPGTKLTIITTDPRGFVVDPYTAAQVDKALRTTTEKEHPTMTNPTRWTDDQLDNLDVRVTRMAQSMATATEIEDLLGRVIDVERTANQAYARVAELELIVEQLRSMPRTVDEVDQRIVGLLTTISPVKLTGPQVREELNLLDATDGRLIRLVQEGKIQLHEKPAPNGQRVYRSYFV